VKIRIGFVGLRIGFVDISLEYGNKFPDSVNDEEFLDKMNDYQVLKKDSAESSGVVAIRDILTSV
jgi:hypothetical protein